MTSPSHQERTERILESLDGLQKATAPDYFYTRLEARMHREIPGRKQFPILRPIFITAVLSVVLAVNIISLVMLERKAKTTTGIEAFAEAYDLNSSSLYE